MNDLKDGFRLVRFEFNYLKRFLFFQLVFILFILYLVVPIVPQYFSNSQLVLDILFFAIVTTFSQLFIPKPFKSQHLKNGIWASHLIILLNQLAIRKKTIVKYRFISYYMMTLTFTGLFLCLLYLFSSYLQQNISISTYVVFSIFWLCLAIYTGGIQPVSDAGTNLILNLIISFLLVGPIIIIVILYIFYFWYSHGFVHWTLMVSEKWPLQTVIISIILASLSYRFWTKRMENKMNKIDYFS